MDINRYEMPRKVIVKESQFKKLILNEYMDSSFNWDEFDAILEQQGIVAAKKYCIEKLGKPIGEGSSRAVFEIDDHTVLKLSLSSHDVSQNLHEYAIFEEIGKSNPLLPRIYGHSDDYIWLWTEKVLPCTHEDFERILGIPYSNDPHQKTDNFSEYGTPKELPDTALDSDGDEEKLSFNSFMVWYADYENGCEDWWSEDEMETFRTWFQHPWIQYLLELMECQSHDEFCDCNFGIAMRNGKPTIVVLDVGYA